MTTDTSPECTFPEESVPAACVLQLPPQSTACRRSGGFHEQRLPCSTHYSSVLYSTEQQEFWLLPRHVAELVQEAIYTLDKHISPDKPADERKKGLDQCGLLDYFLEPHLSNFLLDEDKARLETIEREEPYIEDPSLVMRLRIAARKEKGITPENLYPHDRNLAFQQQEQWSAEREELRGLHQLNIEWKQLRKKAIAHAEEQGYTYEADSLFQPEAIEARARVQNYLQKREEVLSRGANSFSDEEIAQYLAEDKRQLEKALDCRHGCKSELMAYQGWRLKERDKRAFADYRDAIISVADYGLAVPEFALLPARGASVVTGIETFKTYLALETKQRQITEAIRKKYQDWIDATGQSTPAPAGLVDQERAEWDAHQKTKKAMQSVAEANVAKSFPRRHLLWNPEEFKPKTVERLVKADFPLREVSTLDTPNKTLSHFSLLNLDDLENTLKETFARSVQEARYRQRFIPENSDGQASVDTVTTVFHEWLTREGAKRIPDQESDWFDAEGWFDVELFHSYLLKQHYRVELLSDPERRQQWGQRLQQMIFKDSVRRQLRLFDNSPQAQLVRCLTPPQQSIHGSATLAGPNFTLSKGFGSSAEATLDIDLARGEVELFKLDIPPREEATPLKVTYRNYRGQPTELDLGRFSMHLGARAWGFTGASLMLSTELQFSHENVRYGNNLIAREQATRSGGDRPASGKQTTLKQEKTLQTGPLIKGAGTKLQIENGAVSKFHLFAGTQAGLKITGALNWAPPREGVGPPQTISQRDALNAPSNWLSLARLTGEVGIGLGLGFTGEFNLSLHEGRLILALKASVVAGPGAMGSFKFEVGYEAIFAIHNLFRRELHKNNYHPLVWVEPEASDFMSKISLLGAMGLDPAMIYLMAYDKIMTLYEALFRAGKGGVIAHTIMTYPNRAELRKWLVNAPPQALGPLLHTLIFEPKAFEIPTTTSEQHQKTIFNETECHYLQQQAVELIIASIINGVSDTLRQKRLFTDSCRRMNKHGSLAVDNSHSYCTNRLLLDAFMRVPVRRIFDRRSDETRNNYFIYASSLGAEADNECRAVRSRAANYTIEPHLKFGR
nr:hypothetical protein [uncultured Pseudomonas sp.]